jgi:hypothetical protein
VKHTVFSIQILHYVDRSWHEGVILHLGLLDKLYSVVRVNIDDTSLLIASMILTKLSTDIC